ncbi:MAG: NAD(P)-dependent oxidoreductase [Caldilineaceae bacterium]
MHKTLFLTQRSLLHQRHALAAAPPELTITMLRDPARQTILAEIADAEFLISERAGLIDHTVIEAGRKLRLIQRLGSQTHDIDMAAAAARGIPVCYWPIAGAIAVAEHVLWQMLALARRAHEVEDALHTPDDWGDPRRTDENVFAFNWTKRTSPVALWRRTVGILGFGEIGVEVARRLRGFECPILYHKRTRLPHSVETELGLHYADPSTLLAQSDVVCSLLPYAPQTDHLLDAAALAQMKPGAFLVHCGSGSVIDEVALAVALGAGRLGGAALDTFEWEPLPAESPLRALAADPQANVVLTPHTAAVSQHRGRDEEYANLRAVLSGAPLRYRLV